jgi:hypothetical protein
MSSSSTLANLIVALQVIFLLYSYIPWEYQTVRRSYASFSKHILDKFDVSKISFVPPKATSPFVLDIPYPPKETITSLELYTLILKLVSQAYILPALFGSLISFSNHTNAVVDPVTSSIVRLVAAVSHDFGVPEEFVSQKTRIVGGGTALAFAFAESVVASGSPTGRGAERVTGTRGQITTTPKRKQITAS